MLRKIYSVQGNIGSGKSTLLSIIQKSFPKVRIVAQPVAQWQNISKKHNLLEQYYKDPQRWAFTFQANAVLSRMTQLHNLLQSMELSPNCQFLTQRSITADKQIFAKLLFEEKKLSEMEYQIYLNMFQSLNNLFKHPKQNKYIYLRSSPQICFERVKIRNRFEEQTIELKYFAHIHELHEKWLKYEQQEKNVLIINGDKQFETNQSRMEEIVKLIDAFIL